MSRLTFDAKKHYYELDGKPITGTTKILQVIAKPALINWAAGVAVEYICEHIKELIIGTKEEQDRILKEAKFAHRRKKESAGDIGKAVHELVENWIGLTHLNRPAKKKFPELAKLSEKEQAQSKRMAELFYAWATDDKVKFFDSEHQTFSEKYWFCGTADFLCEIDGKTYLGDLKTSSGIYPDMWAQCAAYAICEEEQNPGLKISGFQIVNIRKDETIQTKQSFDLVGYKRMFLSALIIFRQLEEKKQ